MSVKFVSLLTAALLTSTVAFADDDGGMRAFLINNPKGASIQKPTSSSPSTGPGYITAAAHRHGLNPRLLHAIVKVESGGNCHARSYANAQGVGQVKPATARSVGVYGNLYNCETGIEAAARYLKVAVGKAGAGCAGVSLYNLGVYARPRCTGYGRKVIAHL